MNGGQVQLPKLSTRGRDFFCSPNNVFGDCPSTDITVASGAIWPLRASLKHVSKYHLRRNRFRNSKEPIEVAKSPVAIDVPARTRLVLVAINFLRPGTSFIKSHSVDTIGTRNRKKVKSRVNLPVSCHRAIISFYVCDSYLQNIHTHIHTVNQLREQT